ncbi:SDR family oxidoreductase [Clostridium botulinum]|nr:SDR family oxidoreductase [Clostridium botulinum]NFI77410.1 SDR family oxidoreductase [Clostridium botulinum]NFI84897.1 SDR family oxidoreductase [Clostridium botulinum]NFJ38448.1 SDR family oxidoreductase [Clostridium botulinum]NFS22746.1 SDR family oxidoreductase [Clostridium botulinum]
MLKKVLVIGASGFLGKEVYNNFKIDSNYKVYGTYSKTIDNNFYYLDITDSNSIYNVFSLICPDIVIITAALTNVEFCENNKEKSYKINVYGIKNIAKVCKEYKSKVIYVSTEYVFDGINGPYDERDAVNPINYYGKAKLLGEKIIEKNIDNNLIGRTTVVYGWDISSKNFVMQLVKNLSENKSMKVPKDQISSPTYCPNLAKMIKECCDRDIKGILNLAGSDIMDRYTFAVKATEILGLNKELIIPIETEKLGQIAKRPLNAGLKINKAYNLLENKPKGVIEGLKELKKIYSEHCREKLNE